MKRHELKTWPGPFSAMERGDKTHEVRRDDRGFSIGDELWLREWEPTSEQYTGRELLADVRYISRGPDWGLPDGMVVMSVRATRIA